MGSRSSKESPKSYDVGLSAEVSDQDSVYKRSESSPAVTVTPAVVTLEEGEECKAADVSNKETPTSSENCVTTDSQQTQSTSAATATYENKKAEPQEQPDDPRIPSWVNEDNFKPLLSQLHDNFAEIVSFKAYPALVAGENFATLMLRVKITIKLQDASTVDHSYMLKVAHDNKQMQDMLAHNKFFVAENTVYNEVIPEMKQMYDQVGRAVQFGPKAYQLDGQATSSNYVLLEDLCLRNFKNANRLECMNMEHTLAVLRKFAQFHAASACRIAVKGPYAETFSPNMDNERTRSTTATTFASFKKPFMDNLKTYDNGEKYEEALSNFFDNVIEEYIYGRTPRPDYFNVLNHGDAWSNNILFTYTDAGIVDEVLLVDFQNTNYGSPAQDLFSFIITSTQADIKVSQYDYFIHYYHRHLEENLRLLNYPAHVPTLRELHLQLIDYGTWATFMSFMGMGAVLLDSTDIAKFENFLDAKQEGLAFKNAMFSNSRYRQHINELLPWLFSKGFMEIH